MYCNKCGKKLPQDSDICPECGNILKSDSVGINAKTNQKTNKQPSSIKLFLLGSGIGLVIIIIMFAVFSQTSTKRKILF